MVPVVPVVPMVLLVPQVSDFVLGSEFINCAVQ